METCIIDSPLGFTKIVGDIDGVCAITVLNSDEKITDVIPLELEDCVLQLKEYFNGTRKHFSFKINPQGTEFQKRVWQELLTIPFGKTTSYLNLSKQLGDVKAIRGGSKCQWKESAMDCNSMSSRYRKRWKPNRLCRRTP